MQISRWTPFVFAAPENYISAHPEILSLDLEEWSEEFEWEQDGWNGYKDFASKPAETVRTGRGDCEDYALVAASWAYDRGYPMVLVWLFKGYSPMPRHMVVWFKGNIYSSGNIFEGMSVSDYVEQSEYDWCLEHKID